jgi:hypothetical protein
VAAPTFDRYGLHAETCECPRCTLGFRPTLSNRWAARVAWERAEQRKKDAAAKAAKDAAPGGRLSKREAIAAREEAARKAAKDAIEKFRGPVERPATTEELRKMREEFFPELNRRRKDGRR